MFKSLSPAAAQQLEDLLFQGVLCFVLSFVLYFLVSLILNYFSRSNRYHPDDFVSAGFRRLYCRHGLTTLSINKRFIFFVVSYLLVYGLSFLAIYTHSLLAQSIGEAIAFFATFYFFAAFVLAFFYFLGAVIRYFKLPSDTRMDYRIPVHFAAWNMHFSFFLFLLFLFGC